jgi:tetratricopeptide (TPR) repeat protein
MKRALLVGLAWLLIAPTAHASAADDGNAGLDALNAGDYPKAASLFTRALDSGELHGDDKEFAYANRGRAYLKMGDLSRAIPDLDRACRQKPDDADAQSDLSAAIATKLPAASIPGLPKANFWQQLGQAFVQDVAAGLQGDGSQGDGSQ